MKMSLACIFSCFVFGQETTHSTFGFSMEVPDNWIVMTRQEIKENADLFSDFELPGVDPAMTKIIQSKIQSGQLEFFFRKGAASNFADNINVTKNLQQEIKGDEELAQLCEVLPAEIAKLYGKAVKSYACDLRSIGGHSAVYLDFDGVVDGTRNIQYQIQKSKNFALIFTLTVKNENRKKAQSEFEAMLKTLKFD